MITTSLSSTPVIELAMALMRRTLVLGSVAAFDASPALARLSVTRPVVSLIVVVDLVIADEVQPQGKVFALAPLPDFATTITLLKPVGMSPNIEIVCKLAAQQVLITPPAFEGTSVM